VGQEVGDRRGELAPLVALEQFEQVGDVGGVERFDQLVGAAVVVRLERLDHRIDELRLEQVVLVELLVLLAGRVGFQLGEVLLGHAARSMPVERKSKLTSAPVTLYGALK
jgi:hypothetical protein